MDEKNLILDFDGVLLDTLPFVYTDMAEKGIDIKDTPRATEFLENYRQWNELIKKAPEINNNIYYLNKIIESKIFEEVFVATHFINRIEANEKIVYLNKFVPKLSLIIPVPKEQSKTNAFSPNIIKKSILVDDHTPNVDDWNIAGGIGIKFVKKIDPLKQYKTHVITCLSEIFTLAKMGAFDNYEQNDKQKVMTKNMKVNKLGYYI